MRRLVALARGAAASGGPVLLRGESGTGKAAVAHAIHYHGAVAGAPFLTLAVALTPPAHLGRALFGAAAARGAAAQPGLCQLAEGGTLYLADLADVPPPEQEALVRLCERGEVVRVGAKRPERVTLRLLAGTSRDLAARLAAGTLRKELFYALARTELELPPLRDRGDDVLLIARHVAAAVAREAGRAPPRFSDRTVAVLKGHAWPGNVRELVDLVRRLAVAATGDVIDAPDLPSLMRFTALKDVLPRRTLEEMELQYVRSVVDSVDGNQTRAAEILQIDRKTLREKLRRV
jgi:DNA-binding NtrC family response regulator